jgi:two-component system sensor histidine kinase VicK
MLDELELFRPLFEHSNEICFAYDLTDRRIVYASAAYEQVIGDPVAHLGEDLPYLLDRIFPDDRQYLRQRLAQVAPGEVVQDVELRMMRANGGTQWMQLSICQRQMPQGAQYLVGRARDITLAKETSNNSEKFNAKKDATLEILSHDLAAPLALLQQLTDHLTFEIDTTNSKVHELLSLMQRTCLQGVTLIRDFVDNEFLESSNVELKLERVDLVSWLRVVMDEYQQSEQHTLLQFSFTPSEEIIYATIDLNKLQQVVNNLISNAIKFTPDGGHIAVSIARQPTQLLLTVADTGIGIPAELQPIIFEKFTKARRPGLRGERTTGLGMSVIKTIVGLHKGHIRLESAEGKGTTFYIELPILMG